MSVEARFVNDAVSFKRLIDAVKEVVTEVLFDCSEEGIEMQAMDSSHVALVFFHLDAKKAFSHYNCKERTSIGVNIIALQKVMKLCNNDDILTLRRNKGEDKINFLFEARKGSKISQTSLSLLDIDEEKLGIPDAQYKTYIKMSSQELFKICKDFKELSDTVIISSDKMGVKFAFNGDISSGDVTLVPDTSMDDDTQPPISINVIEPTSASFATKYLMHFSKGSTLAPVAEISLSDELPLMIEYKFPEGFLKYFMAPKINDE